MMRIASCAMRILSKAIVSVTSRGVDQSIWTGPRRVPDPLERPLRRPRSRSGRVSRGRPAGRTSCCTSARIVIRPARGGSHGTTAVPCAPGPSGTPGTPGTRCVAGLPAEIEPGERDGPFTPEAPRRCRFDAARPRLHGTRPDAPCRTCPDRAVDRCGRAEATEGGQSRGQSRGRRTAGSRHGGQAHLGPDVRARTEPTGRHLGCPGPHRRDEAAYRYAVCVRACVRDTCRETGDGASSSRRRVGAPGPGGETSPDRTGVTG